ncbi:bifunctional 2-C-methyl-D-erythritol 4-phosphate cytidylyltransferase/2-C-methyl-D-erythritol 2,4-cyclodiphosphate synthase [Maritimibacter sp. UBA3975]|uniref:bifunctional 2-C-methyl-D-erythritol 4-phosphate cytidylyltransferase/2-C-methyl-D-erythritol 2,4-cyclodiphosphate synthase n=1 Tax=Maritimibacter sp. UBA3975 TaxID=1946833 RepID=UPI000C08F5F8|nr:bifunctional 2-C-methyl-D-erythritol 4-phosphate cytidylyltransferase/2-C-methyl-D-erythritol 2,4-cyclodiphosphate synthase [Maritimibacter sp. UBA3975]MAM60172.1 bifunctional 2-C-methyl-D-erythritol 4-phosphate cytidylyltransferase/2-C-methyl-D-erythritol 2,4-cyclodiphosphate synthase [Maritimibacter sp.]|tara:strand:- start:6600 stop:7730 length:1131 start_codon:yes stop_codon:yes gene_type:complete
MEIAAIIVAAGRGTRAGGDVPKQWRALAGRRVADWTLAAFAGHPRVGRIVVVLHPDDMGQADTFTDVIVATGGATRHASVAAGLEALAGDPPDGVLIHDIARPLATPDLIDRVIDALDHAGGAAPALAVTDALWTGADDRVTGTRDRDGLYRAQTPQGFRYAAYLDAHRAHPGDAADDVAVARSAGLDVTIVAGDERNLKITGPDDFARAEELMGGRVDIRTGTGFDVHAFTTGDAVTLCGVTVPHERALKGHSDADVGMHALTDAIYGALAEGDIGQHFPPSDDEWKGAASEIFLRHAVDLATSKGYRVSNCDVTLICEMPKIGPHAGAMRAELARIMGLEADRVSVKATTSERLGFTGRGEGIAAQAVATLVRP